jgi:hypothetical protein
LNLRLPLFTKAVEKQSDADTRQNFLAQKVAMYYRCGALEIGATAPGPSGVPAAVSIVFTDNCSDALDNDLVIGSANTEHPRHGRTADT